MKNFIKKWLLKFLLKADVLVSNEKEKKLSFANNPTNVHISLPRQISSSKYIFMGDDVELGPGCMLKPIDRYPSKWLTDVGRYKQLQEFSPRIIIGDRVTLLQGYRFRPIMKSELMRM